MNLVHKRSRPCRVCLGLIALLGTAVLPAGAHAGTYTIRACNVPDKPSESAAPWGWMPANPYMFPHDECASGGGYGLNAGSMPIGTGAAVVLKSPTDRIAIRRVRLWMTARLAGTGSSLHVLTSSGGVSSGEAHENIFGPPGGETLRVPWTSAELANDTTIYHVILGCSADAGVGCNPSSATPLDIRGAEVVLSEGTLPVATIEGGSLVTSEGPRTGEQTIVYKATDSESGVSKVSALLGSRVVGVRASSCTHSDFAACPTEQRDSIAIDTSAVPDGIYPLALEVLDAAGNRQTVVAERGVAVSNPPPSKAARIAPNVQVSKLSVSVGRQGRYATAIRYGQTIVVLGRLENEDRPVAGATLAVWQRGIRQQRWRSAGSVRTRRDGTFSLRRRVLGPSRWMELRYRETGGGITHSRKLRIEVAASGSLSVALKRTDVRYRGQVRGRPFPPGGKRVYMEGRAMGGRWTRFAQLRTDKRGRFSGRYRLRVYRPGVRLQFRARIPAERGYRYLTGLSGVVTRRVG